MCNLRVTQYNSASLNFYHRTIFFAPRKLCFIVPSDVTAFTVIQCNCKTRRIMCHKFRKPEEFDIRFVWSEIFRLKLLTPILTPTAYNIWCQTVVFKGTKRNSKCRETP